MKILPNLPGFCFLVKTYFSCQDARKEIVALREAGFAAQRAGDAAGASSLFTEEKAKIGSLYYKLCSDVSAHFHVTIRVRGTENLPPDGSTFAVVANHQSYADVAAVGYALGGRQISFVAKQAFEKIPLYGKFLPDLRAIYIPTLDSKRAQVAVIKQGVEYLNQGFNMAIFPEGKRSWNAYQDHFMKGSMQLATRAGVPLVPIALEGGYHFFEETGVFSPCEILVSILPPVETKDIPKSEHSALFDQIEAAVKAESRKLHREVGIPEDGEPLVTTFH